MFEYLMLCINDDDSKLFESYLENSDCLIHMSISSKRFQFHLCQTFTDSNDGLKLSHSDWDRKSLLTLLLYFSI